MASIEEMFNLLYMNDKLSVRAGTIGIANTIRQGFYRYKKRLDAEVSLLYDDPSAAPIKSLSMTYDKEKGIAHFVLQDSTRGKYELVEDEDIRPDLESTEATESCQSPVPAGTSEANQESSDETEG